MPRPALMIQDEIARVIVGIMPHPWKRIVLNYEIDDEEEMHSSAIFFHVVQAPSGELAIEDEPFLPNEAENLLFELQGAMLATAGSRWGICDLLIEEDGRYAFTFDYGRAKRINAILDEASYDRFKNYLVHYRAELTAAG